MDGRQRFGAAWRASMAASAVGGSGYGGRRKLLSPPRHASRERRQRGKERWGKGLIGWVRRAVIDG
jgi:hypothetical protein